MIRTGHQSRPIAEQTIMGGSSARNSRRLGTEPKVCDVSEGNQKEESMAMYVGIGVALGVGLDAAFGSALGNVAMGTALGKQY